MDLRLILLAILLQPVLLTAQSDPTWSWDWITPHAPGVDVAGITMIDSTHGWLSLHRGPIYRTDDGGITWETYDQGYGASTIFPVDRSILYAASLLGKPTYLKSVDGGVTWDSVEVEGAPRFSLMAFSDSENGWGIDFTTGKTYRTTNGGTAWSLFERSSTIRSIVPLSRDTILYTDLQGLWRTTDGGTVWQQTGQYRAGKLYFRSPTQGWLVLDTVYRTLDAGATWRKGVPGMGSMTWMQFADSLHGYIGTRTRGFFTRDGGATWQFDIGDGPNHLNFSHAGRGRWYLERIDSGAIGRLDILTRRFDTIYPPVPVQPVDMAIEGRSIALLYSSAGAVTDTLLWFSSDGGMSWTKNVILPGAFSWRGVDMQGDTIWVTGPTELLVSYDRGASWRVVLDGVLDDMRGIDLKSGTAGGVVSDEEILMFERNGDSWHIHDRLRAATPPLPWSLTDIRFVTSLFGYATAGARPVLYTYDGGVTWHLPTEDGPLGAGNVSWLNDSVGMSAIWFTTFITIDQGRTWGQVMTPGAGLDGPGYLHMFDTTTGLATTSTSGRLFRTTDRGETWQWLTNTPHAMSDPLQKPEKFGCTSTDTCWRIAQDRVLRMTRGRTLGVETDHRNDSPEDIRTALMWGGDEITLDLRALPGAGTHEEYRLTIADVRGRTIATLTSTAAGGFCRFDTEGLALERGVYVVAVAMRDRTLSRLFIRN